MYIQTASLAETVADLGSGRISLHRYIDDLCDRIEQIDVHTESLLPERGRRQRLLTEAAALGQRFPDINNRPPLFGIPVGIKDIFHVDGFTTKAGTKVPPESFVGPEAICVRQLKEAGALILGKTVTTEFAYFEPGPTRNPHNLEHTPGGSSSGSAAAVSAGLCPLALGTQTIGSVIRPAAFCGIVGFKPSYNRIATKGLVYFSQTADHVGLFTQDVESMTQAAAVLCQNWQSQPNSTTLPVLGVPDGPYLQQAEPEALALFEDTLTQLNKAGCEIKRVPAFDQIEQLNQLHRRLTFAEFAQEHEKRYAVYGELYRPRTAEIVEIGMTVEPEEITASRANCLKLRKELEDQMTESGIDLWVSPPATGPAPKGIHATGDPIMNLPWTHSGMPALTVPASTAANGLPLGLQLVGRFGEDEYLLSLAQKVADLISRSRRK